ncbi:MAG TPA: bifunctional UDP-3-O-[3-hydroxymyristoyl] N-acetylglucosamine deacetylase/3-hydroxyacyl-ACP dehydratase [Candidatus Krumholzibacteria bacterium]|nr:bifunctional UDP-3-O-[3-hydroxymyristoyl] N-acetylglucosamine deacetylase/3-hydroxyacyl-ACP dehydratase [Candidatus Krumholzibacteria bacterium]
MIRQQRTIAKEFVIEGLGLHTGNTVKMRVKPAPAGTGIKFLRVDLNPVVEIPAVVTSIPPDGTSYRNTTVSTGTAEIHTVEHLLATCYGLGIDNLIIEIDANEPPEPASGTYAAYVRAFEDAGTVNQGAPADVFTIDRAVTLKENGVEINAVPADDFRVSFTIQYDNPQIGTQYASFTVSPEVFEKEIAPARTFVMLDDVDKLRKQGLIKGGNLGNAIVFTPDGVMNEESLRFPDECVRHKILDLIGDLSLLGAPIRGHVHAVRSGHAANVRFVRKLWEMHQNKKRGAAASEAGVWDINLIQAIMPHRYPFLLVDRIIELEDRKRVVGIKNVTINEPFFNGHFPGHPIMPAVLIIEAMAQTGGVMLLNTVDDPKKYLVYFTRVDKAKFRRPVLPGDQLRFELEMKSLRRGLCTMQGFAYVDGKLAAEAELSSVIVER